MAKAEEYRKIFKPTSLLNLIQVSSLVTILCYCLKLYSYIYVELGELFTEDLINLLSFFFQFNCWKVSHSYVYDFC